MHTFFYIDILADFGRFFCKMEPSSSALSVSAAGASILTQSSFRVFNFQAFEWRGQNDITPAHVHIITAERSAFTAPTQSCPLQHNILLHSYL